MILTQTQRHRVIVQFFASEPPSLPTIGPYRPLPVGVSENPYPPFCSRAYDDPDTSVPCSTTT